MTGFWLEQTEKKEEGILNIRHQINQISNVQIIAEVKIDRTWLASKKIIFNWDKQHVAGEKKNSTSKEISDEEKLKKSI